MINVRDEHITSLNLLRLRTVRQVCSQQSPKHAEVQLYGAVRQGGRRQEDHSTAWEIGDHAVLEGQGD